MVSDQDVPKFDQITQRLCRKLKRAQLEDLLRCKIFDELLGKVQSDPSKKKRQQDKPVGARGRVASPI